MAIAKSSALITEHALFKSVEPVNAFRKAVEVVHCTPSTQFSLLQGKITNCWLKHALEHEPSDDGWWTIKRKKMTEEIGFNSNNLDHLKKSAHAMTKIVCEYDVIKPSRRNKPPSISDSINTNSKIAIETISCALFAVSTSTDSTNIRFQINSLILEKILTHLVYAVVDNNVLRRFKKAASIPIYEFCARFVNAGQTPEVDINLFRSMVLGKDYEDGIYKDYKYFYRDIVKLSVAEINTHSELFIEYVDLVENKLVEKIKFNIKRKEEKPLPSNDNGGEVNIQLELFGFSPLQSRKLVKGYSVSQLITALEYTRARILDGDSKIRLPLAYFKKALENGWGCDTTLPLSDIINSTESVQYTLKNIESKYAAHQISEAERYFSELDSLPQEELISQYNGLQAMDTMKFHSGKVKIVAKTGFFNWLALLTWGAPTEADIASFTASLEIN